MTAEARNPNSVHAPLAAYSHQVELRGALRWLVLSGQVGMTQDGSVPDEPTLQFAIALSNVLRNVEAAGMSAADIVKLTFYLVEDIGAAERAAILNDALGDIRPCMTLLFVPRLASPRLKVEIDAWAAADEK